MAHTTQETEQTTKRITLEQIDLKQIKKALGFNKASFRYHNKHKQGSGNFGTNLTKGTYNTPQWENWEISGEYNSNKELVRLSFGEAYQCGIRVPSNVTTTQELIVFIAKAIETIKEAAL